MSARPRHVQTAHDVERLEEEAVEELPNPLLIEGLSKDLAEGALAAQRREEGVERSRGDQPAVWARREEGGAHVVCHDCVLSVWCRGC